MSAGPKVDVSMEEAARLHQAIHDLPWIGMSKEKREPMSPFMSAMNLFNQQPEAVPYQTRVRATYPQALAAFDALVPATAVEAQVVAERPLAPTPAVAPTGTADVDRQDHAPQGEGAVPEAGGAMSAVPEPSIEDATDLLRTIHGPGRFLMSETQRAPLVPFITAMATYVASGKEADASPALEAYPSALEALTALGIVPQGAAEKLAESPPAVGTSGPAEADRQDDVSHREETVAGRDGVSAGPAPEITIEKATRLRHAIRKLWWHFSKAQQAPMLPFMHAMGDFNYSSKGGLDVERALAEYAQAHAEFVALAPVERVEALAAADDPVGTEGDASAVLNKAYPQALAAVAELGIAPEGAAEKLDEKPVEAPAASGPAAQHGDVNPSTLLVHAFNTELFGTELIETPKQEAFEQDIAAHGVTKPIIVTGTGCHSKPNTILAGHRRAVAAAKAGRRVMVVVRNGLTELEEVTLLVRDNLADEHVRKLTVEQKWAMEEKLRELHGKNPGRRTDLQVPGGHLAEISARSRTVHRNEIIGKVVDESPSAVADRAKVYGSPLSTPNVKKAVSGRLIGTSTAAKMLRAGEKKLGHGIDEPTVREAAQAEIDAQVQDAVVKKKGPRKKGKGKRAPQELASSDIASEARKGASAEACAYPERSEWATTENSARLRELTDDLVDVAWFAFHGIWLHYARKARARGRDVPDSLLSYRHNPEDVVPCDDADALRVVETLERVLAPLFHEALEDVITEIERDGVEQVRAGAVGTPSEAPRPQVAGEAEVAAADE